VKIAFFDTLLEDRVVTDLAVALNSLGVEVMQTGKVWQGHMLPKASDDVSKIDRAIQRVIDFCPELILVFRQSAITEQSLMRLRQGGASLFLWLPDDPVLYKAYARTVDAYDLVLHCGNQKVLELYDSKGHKPGVNFPFWVDPERVFRIQREHSSSTMLPACFFGNVAGRIKTSRGARLAEIAKALDCNIDVYGNYSPDLHLEGVTAKGYLDDDVQTASALARYYFSINLPQVFSSYEGTRWWLPEFSEMGAFDVPSRIIQFAAMGLPIVTLSNTSQGEHFPVDHFPEANSGFVEWANRIICDPLFSAEVARRSYAHFKSYFTALSRARYLLSLARKECKPVTLHQRVWSYRDF